MIWGLKVSYLRVPRCHFQADKWLPFTSCRRSIFAVKVASKSASVTV